MLTLKQILLELNLQIDVAIANNDIEKIESLHAKVKDIVKKIKE